MSFVDDETITTDLRPKRVWRLDVDGGPKSAEPKGAALRARRGLPQFVVNSGCLMSVYVTGETADVALEAARALLRARRIVVVRESPIVELTKEEVLRGY